MNDYLRKAVELADGFGLNHTTIGGQLVFRYPTGTIVVGKSLKFPQWFLDALAAQLVRECDQKGQMTYGDVLIFQLNSEEYKTKDRSMDTIRAIIDSSALDRQK